MDDRTQRSQHTVSRRDILRATAALALGAAGAGGTSQLAAQNIKKIRFAIATKTVSPVIDLRLPFDRAWASLGRALERANLSVKDLDRSAGVYFVKYETRKQRAEEGDAGVEPGPGAASEEEEKKGFLSRLNPWGGDDEDENPAIGHSYRVEMRGVDQGVVIGVRQIIRGHFHGYMISQ